MFSNEASGIWVESRPNLSELITQIRVHELILSLSGVFEDLQDYRYKQPQEDSRYDEGVRKEEGPRGLAVPASQRLIYYLISYE